MLHIITTLNDPLTRLVQDDPVRPEIPLAARVHEWAEIFVLEENDQPAAVTCVRYMDSVPACVEDLSQVTSPSVAVFYTIWSYQAGAGRRLIQQAQAWQQLNKPEITRWVTLSPKTDMARVFHHRNGAVTLRENTDTVNYEYCARETLSAV
jgi:hypothetical protein